MSWKGSRQGAWNSSGNSEPDARPSVKGVELNIVCGGVPVITLDKMCIFHENVSWMLQSALNASGKADSLYEYCDDDRIVAEARALGLSPDELSIVRLKVKEFGHVKAVGTTGKRSVMLAVVVALALEDFDAMHELWKQLQAYSLDRAFVGLLGSGRRRAVADKNDRGYSDAKWNWNAGWQAGPSSFGGKGGGKSNEVPIEPPDGVDLNVVCGLVPVLDLDKSSILHENVSWLLQTAMDSSGKADSLYEHCMDREVMSACRKQLQLCDQEVGLVSLKRSDLKHIKAVGTAGKRSIMLAVVVALVLNNEVQCDDLKVEVREYDAKLFKPLDQLFRAAKYLTGSSRPPAKSTGWALSWTGAGSQDASSSGGKRKWKEDDADSSRCWQPPPKTKKASAGRTNRVEEPSHKSLDRQLDQYWEDERADEHARAAARAPGPTA